MENNASQTGAFTINDAVNGLLAQSEPSPDQGQASEPQVEASQEVDTAEQDSQDAEPEQAVDDEGEQQQPESEDDSEDAGDDDQVEQEQDDEEPLFTVKVDGEELQVTAQQLKDNYQLNQATQKRLQEASESRKQAEAVRAEAEQSRAQYLQGLQAIQAQLENQEPGQEYWDNLRETDPQKFLIEREQARERNEMRQAVIAEQQAVEAQYLQEQERKLVEIIPEWSDNAKRQTETSQLVETAKGLGFSTHEIGMVKDARMVALLRKASLYDRMMERGAEVKKEVKKAPKMAKSSARKPQTDQKTLDRRKALQQHQKNPTVASAVEALMRR
jgi:hypothetical protein